jgi:hypothetical protein
MFNKRMLLTVLAGVVLLALAMPQVWNVNAASVTVPYAGRLADEAGQPVMDGTYDFTFALYDAETDGALVWSEVQPGVKVTGGDFAAVLGSVNLVSAATMDGGRRWLAVGVRGPGESAFTALTPRQRLGAGSPVSTAALAAAACPHDHFGESWSGSGLVGLLVDTTNGNFGGAVAGLTRGLGYGVVGEQRTTTSAAGAGVFGFSNSPIGYGGRFSNSGGGIGLYAIGNGGGADRTALRVENTKSGDGMAAYMTNNSAYHTAHFDNDGTGGVLYLSNGGDANGTGGYDFITAVNSAQNDPQFRVESNGAVASDDTFYSWGADFAEMLPAVDGLEPGDVLVIGPDGKLTKSTEPYQPTVVGVYSTKPGFVGGHPVEGALAGEIPLAVVGVVPVKVSTENGAIKPGDLLVASSISGYAMKAGSNPPQGTVIGKALEKLDAGTGVIKMLATLQ